MRAKMNIALRKRTLSPVRLVLEDSSKRSFVLFVVTCFFTTGEYNRIYRMSIIEVDPRVRFTYTRYLRASSSFFTSRVIYTYFTRNLRVPYAR